MMHPNLESSLEINILAGKSYGILHYFHVPTVCATGPRCSPIGHVRDLVLFSATFNVNGDGEII
jgi:hypothetical protein